MKKSIFRKILMGSGVLHILAFFLIPYATLSELLGGLSDLAGMVGEMAGVSGMDAAYPEKLTGLNAVMQSSIVGGDAGFVVVFFLIPVIAAILVVIANIIGKGKVSYIVTVLLGFLMLAGYGIQTIAMEDYRYLGYEVHVTVYIMIILAVVQTVIALVGCMKDKGEAAIAGKSAVKTVKVGKKDGKVTGVSGSYAGAAIPVTSKEPVIIGRDPSVCNIVVKGEKVSRKHCQIEYNPNNDMYMVTCYSANGVFDKGGNRLSENTAVPMYAGSEIHIGKDGDVFRLG